MPAPAVATNLAPNPASGNTAATTGAEQTIAEGLVAGDFRLDMDFTGLVAGDILEIRAYGKAVSGGAYLLIDSVTAAYPGRGMLQFGWHSGVHGVKYTMIRLTGADRAYPFSVLNRG